ncbi:MAG: TM2 domain-containing protein [Bacteroidales bacterium]|nr:TM2 domain-containing protein [Bacteroidales bacterium]MCF8343547.1 TM2 domain-containing protein [Bacteroidales bacterium]MCF8375598.1 TM2 domain-containing protein [Bacteroidales bacterium]
MAHILNFMPELHGQELVYVQNLTDGFTDNQLQQFSNIYRYRRKDPNIILVATLVGFLGFAGIQRFIVGHIGMGILYFFTAGLCFIGTIVDLINYQEIAFNFNRRIADEVNAVVKSMKA